MSLYFVPEFCSLSGLEDDATKDGYFMKELEKYTKLDPTIRVNKTNEFLYLLSDNEKDPHFPDRLSSKEKCELYGIEVQPVSLFFLLIIWKKPNFVLEIIKIFVQMKLLSLFYKKKI